MVIEPLANLRYCNVSASGIFNTCYLPYYILIKLINIIVSEGYVIWKYTEYYYIWSPLISNIQSPKYVWIRLSRNRVSKKYFEVQSAVHRGKQVEVGDYWIILGGLSVRKLVCFKS